LHEGEVQAFEVASYTDVAKLFKEGADYKELAKFMAHCRELRHKVVGHEDSLLSLDSFNFMLRKSNAE
jgi:hypothetical protein